MRLIGYRIYDQINDAEDAAYITVKKLGRLPTDAGLHDLTDIQKFHPSISAFYIDHALDEEVNL